MFSNQGLVICHCNLNSVSAIMYTEVSLLPTYMSVHKFDIICLSETYLISRTSSDDDNLEVLRYNIIKEDHLSKSKWGTVCVYYRNSPPFKVINLIYLQECISLEIENKKLLGFQISKSDTCMKSWKTLNWI